MTGEQLVFKIQQAQTLFGRRSEVRFMAHDPERTLKVRPAAFVEAGHQVWLRYNIETDTFVDSPSRDSTLSTEGYQTDEIR